MVTKTQKETYGTYNDIEKDEPRIAENKFYGKLLIALTLGSCISTAILIAGLIILYSTEIISNTLFTILFFTIILGCGFITIIIFFTCMYCYQKNKITKL